MKTFLVSLFAAAVLLLNMTPATAQKAKQNDVNTVFARGEPRVSPNFTGKTYLTPLSDRDKRWNTAIGNVTFEPKARTHWHSHSAGQILLIVGGTGYIGEKGKPARKVQKGEIVRIPAGLVHFQAAAPNSMFEHVSIEPNATNNKHTWLGPVTDEEYAAAIKE